MLIQKKLNKIILVIILCFAVYAGFVFWQIYKTIYKIDFDKSQIERTEIEKELWGKVMSQIENRADQLQSGLDKTYKNPF